MNVQTGEETTYVVSFLDLLVNKDFADKRVTFASDFRDDDLKLLDVAQVQPWGNLSGANKISRVPDNVPSRPSSHNLLRLVLYPTFHQSQTYPYTYLYFDCIHLED